MVIQKNLTKQILSISILAIMLVLGINTFCSAQESFPIQERFPMMEDDPRDILLRRNNSSNYDFSKAVSAEADSNVEYVSSCLWTGVNDVVVDGNYAYCAFVNGLVILDISDPANPERVSNLYFQGSGGGIDKSGNYVYLADGSSGLQIINVSDPINPIYAGSYDTPGNALSVFVLDSLAYVADRNSGLQIINISDPSNPTYAGSYDTPGYAYSVFVLDSLAYVADYYSGLQIINVSDPSNPIYAGSYDTPGSAWSVFVVDGLAYVADDYNGGLQIINISDPSNPIYAGSYDTPGYALSVFVVDSLAYVADYSSLMILKTDFNSFCCITPGDANHDGTANISDLTYIVDYMFHDGPPSVCFEEFDNNGDCGDVNNILDLTYFIDWMYQGGPAPVDCHNCE